MSRLRQNPNMEIKGVAGRRFKAQKRKEFNAALRALERLQYGCAFMPHLEGFHIGQMVTQMREAKPEYQAWWGKA